MDIQKTFTNQFSTDNIPDELMEMGEDLQQRAVDAASALIEQGYKGPVAAAMAVERAQRWSGISDAPMPYHITPHADGWAVVRADAERASAVEATKDAALTRGRELARNQGAELVIHGEDGMVQAKHSYASG